MRLRFDVPTEEDAAHAAREELVSRFAAWLDGGGRADHPEAEPVDVDLALEWKLAYADGDLGWWTRDHVDRLLVDHLPRKLSASPEQAATIPPSLAALVVFLEAGGLLDEASDPAEVVAARALAQRRAFLDAMADPGNFGMAKGLLAGMGFEDGDLPDEAELQAAMEAFNALPFEERGRILDLVGEGGGPFAGLDEEDDLEAGPEVQLPLREGMKAADLELAAADVPLLRKVDAFAAGIGEAGVKLTKAHQIPLADGRRLVAATGVGDRTEGVRSTADMPEMFSVGQVALAAGAITAEPGRLRAEPQWATLPAGQRWRAVVDGLLAVGAASVAFGAQEPMPAQLAEPADVLAHHLLGVLWMAGEPVPTGLCTEMMAAVAEEYPMPVGAAAQEAIVEARVGDVLAAFEDAGLVTVDGDTVALTPGGPDVVARPLREFGFGIVLASEVADLPAGALLDLVADREDVRDVGAIWAEAHPGRSAAEDLLAALLEDADDKGRVLTGFQVLAAYGDDAVELARGAVDGPAGDQAWLFLAEAGAVAPEDVPVDAVLRAGIDLFTTVADKGTPADVVEMVLAQVPATDHVGFVDRLADADHARTGELLELLGRHHPDKAVAKHARKAAHRWRSAHGG